ncbi:unnamed protein product [Arctia plantaginis]|uniref:Uncharacterized protein n=1 Tax=Arctia plantaginis TaxID=874455 RepID=A0A8S1AP72_ARCPL|nr:unnamed protein product [Arctia plantaginis]
MMRAFALLCLFVAPAFSAYSPGLKARFDIWGFGSTSFMDLPRNSARAIQQRWIKVERPSSPPGLESLSLWCPRTDFAVCVLLDDTNYIAGLQIALDEENFSNAYHDWSSQGFTYWSIVENGVSKNFWTAQQYYISASTLATPAATRVANRKHDTILQDGNIWLSGFGGKLYNVSTTVKDFIDIDYTTQACIVWMGEHYYYNMSKTTPCGEKSILPWFPLVHSNQLVGVGFMVFGKINVPSGKTDWFENPGSLAVKLIVPDGPDCLYDLAEKQGVVTMHTYFISNPFSLLCINSGWW